MQAGIELTIMVQAGAKPPARATVTRTCLRVPRNGYNYRERVIGKG